MLKAKELRFGNIVKRRSRDEPLVVDLELLASVQRQAMFFNPVPLTEDWLSKLGFYRFNPEDYPNRWISKDSKTDYTIYIYPEIMTICIDDSNYGKEIPYVHTLQNIWYALEGKELSLPAQ